MPSNPKHNHLETEIEEEFVDWVYQQGGKSLKLRIDGVNGFPDQTVFLNGKVFFIEFKRPGGMPSWKQKDWAKQLREQGQKVLITDSIDKAKEFVTHANQKL